MTRTWWEIRAWLASVMMKWMWSLWPAKNDEAMLIAMLALTAAMARAKAP